MSSIIYTSIDKYQTHIKTACHILHIKMNFEIEKNLFSYLFIAVSASVLSLWSWGLAPITAHGAKNSTVGPSSFNHRFPLRIRLKRILWLLTTWGIYDRRDKTTLSVRFTTSLSRRPSNWHRLKFNECLFQVGKASWSECWSCSCTRTHWCQEVGHRILLTDEIKNYYNDVQIYVIKLKTDIAASIKYFISLNNKTVKSMSHFIFVLGLWLILERIEFCICTDRWILLGILRGVILRVHVVLMMVGVIHHIPTPSVLMVTHMHGWTILMYTNHT